jgi:HAD superfamily hydrolase (TIGR01509 family)
MTPELVIFDCDGVLVDSEPISVAALLDLITASGGSMTEDTAYRLFLGRSMASVRETLRTDFGILLTDAHLDGFRAAILDRFRAELKPIAGVADVLRRLGFRYCVASSSNPDRLRLALGLTGLLELLEPHIYSASMVPRGKPAPDLFLHAAREMGADAGACVVVEDSPAGVAAGRAAGMRVFAFTGGSHAGNAALLAELAAAKPDLVFSDMRDLPGLVAGLGKKAS